MQCPDCPCYDAEKHMCSIPPEYRNPKCLNFKRKDDTTMNCMSSKVQQKKMDLEYQRHQEERAKKLASMTDEEREAFLREERQRQRDAMAFFTTAAAVSATVLGSKY